MAVIINSQLGGTFTLNGLPYAKIYQPLQMGLTDIGLYNINDTRQHLIAPTAYDEFVIDGLTYGTQALTMEALIPVILELTSEAGSLGGYDITQLLKSSEDDTAEGIITFQQPLIIEGETFGGEEVRDIETVLEMASSGLNNGGAISINGGNPARFDVSAGSGVVVDHSTSPPTHTEVVWSAFTNQVITNLATQFNTDIAINAAGAIVQQASFTDEELRSLIFLGGIDHNNQISIDDTFSITVPTKAVGSSLRELAKAIGDLNISGNIYSANGANLSVAKSSGEVFSYGRNFLNDYNAPHHLQTAAVPLASFGYVFNNGSGIGTFTTDTTLVNPNNYDNGSGTLATVGVNNFTIQRLLFFPNANKTFIQYGTAQYNKLEDALDAVPRASFLALAGIRTAMVRGYLIVKEGATALNNGSNAVFLSANRFGIVSSLSAGVAATLDSLTDTTITSIAAGELLKWNGSAWINNTLAEAGIMSAGQQLAQTKALVTNQFFNSYNATTGLFTSAQVGYSQLSGVPSTFTPSAHTLDSHSNVTITANAAGEILKWNGSAWINNTLAEANISAVGHTHLWAEITDKPTTFTPSAHTLDSHSNVTITANAAGEILKWSGSAWINNTLAEANIEEAFSKNTAFNKNFGTTAGTVAEGNDSRILNGQTAFTWGDHSLEGYITSVPTATSTVSGTVKLFSNTVQSIAANAVSATAARTYGLQFNSSGQAVINVPWVNTTYSEISDVNLQNPASSTVGLITGRRIDAWATFKGLTTAAIANWNTAFGWGNHAAEGYLTSSDPVLLDADFTSNGIMVRTAAGVYSNITDNSANWNTAFSWGNHDGLYADVAHTHTFASITSKPTTIGGYGITDFNSLGDARWLAIGATAANSTLFNSLAVTQFGRQIFKTSNTGASDGNKYTKIARITITGQYQNTSTSFRYVSNGSGSADTGAGTVNLRVKQQAAFGNDPLIELNNYYDNWFSAEFGYVIVQNTPTTIVDVYLKNRTSYNEVTAFLTAESTADSSKITWYDSQGYATIPAGYTLDDNRLVISANSDGKVGIGTNDPQKTLHVASGTNETTVIIGASDSLSNVSSRLFLNEGETSVTNSLDYGFSLAYDGLGGSYGLPANVFAIMRHENSAVGAAALAIERATGKVGIGTTAPTDKFQIDASNSQLRLRDTDDGTYTQFSSSSNVLAIRQGSTTANHFFLNSSGNVGIGTSPQEKLHVQDYVNATNRIAMFKGGAITAEDYSYITINNGYSTEYTKEVRLAAIAELGASNQTGFAIFTSPDSAGGDGHERLRVTALGNVGIGTTSPDSRLEVVGDSDYSTIKMTRSEATGTQRTGLISQHYNSAEEDFALLHSYSDTTNSYITLGGGTASQNSVTAIRFFTAANNTTLTGTQRMVLYGSGNLSIGTTTDSGDRVYISGTIKSTSFMYAPDFKIFSDRRLKTNIKDLEIKPINVQWREFEFKANKGKKRLGVIAQELEETHPQFVDTSADGTKTVSYTDLLIAKIAELEERLSKLEKI